MRWNDSTCQLSWRPRLPLSSQAACSVSWSRQCYKVVLLSWRVVTKRMAVRICWLSRRNRARLCGQTTWRLTLRSTRSVARSQGTAGRTRSQPERLTKQSTRLGMKRVIWIALLAAAPGARDRPGPAVQGASDARHQIALGRGGRTVPRGRGDGQRESGGAQPLPWADARARAGRPAWTHTRAARGDGIANENPQGRGSPARRRGRAARARTRRALRRKARYAGNGR
jgi:hypothetical protein